MTSCRVRPGAHAIATQSKRPRDFTGAVLVDINSSVRSDEATTFTWNVFRRESRHVNGRGYERAFFFDAYRG